MALNLSEGSKKNGSFRVARLGPDKVGEAEFCASAGSRMRPRQGASLFRNKMCILGGLSRDGACADFRR